MSDQESSITSDPSGVAPSAVSGMRPAARGDSVRIEATARNGSAWTPVATVAWLLAMTPAAVIAVRAGFFFSAAVAVLQVALIVGVLMRFAWGRRIHLLLLGIGALFSALLLAMISFDRSEYRFELERFDTTVRGVEGPHAD